MAYRLGRVLIAVLSAAFLVLAVEPMLPRPAAALQVSSTPPTPCRPPWRTVVAVVPGTLVRVVALSARDLWAVGATTAQQTLIEHYDGIRWHVVPGPTIGAAVDVAAPAPDDVWVISAARVIHWNGSTWQPIAPPGLLPSPTRKFTAIASVSASDIWLMGTDPDVPSTHVLLEHWNGQRWTVVPSPDGAAGGPVLQPSAELDAIAAVSSSDVWAVGVLTPGTGGPAPLIEHWNGVTWRVIRGAAVQDSAVGDGDYSTPLISVTARGANDVWATGSFQNGGQGDGMPVPASFTEHWDGKAWHLILPDRYADGYLATVIPTSPSEAWALGAVVEHWDGRRWQVLPDQQGVYSSGVALAAHDIWAVGTSIAHYTGGLCFPGNMQIRTVPASNAIAELAYDRGTGHLFAANFDGSVSLLDSKQATVLNSIPVAGFVEKDDQGGGLILQRMVLDSAERRVFVVEPGSDQVAMLDARQGTMRHTTPVGPRPSSAALDERLHRLFVVNLGHLNSICAGMGSISAIDTRTGTLLFTTPIGTMSSLVSNCANYYLSHSLIDDDYVSMTVAANGDRVFVMNQAGMVMLNALSGKILKTIPLNGCEQCALLADTATGLLYLDQGDRVTMYQARTGVQVHPASTQSSLPPGRQRGRLIVLGSVVYRIDPTTGAILSTVAQGDVVAVTSTDQHVVVSYTPDADHYGNPRGNAFVSELDAAGNVLYRLAIGGSSVAMAVDDQARLAFIVCVQPLDANTGPYTIQGGTFINIVKIGPQPAV